MKKDLIEISNAPSSWRLRPVLQKLLMALRRGGWVSKTATVVLSVSFVDAQEMTKLNKKFRGKKKPTDVLSFEQPNAGAPNLVLLGDLVLCTDVVRAQAKEIGHGVRDEATILAAHGLLHLLGYDHERSAKEQKRQLAAEARLLRLAGFTSLVKTALIHRNGLGKK